MFLFLFFKDSTTKKQQIYKKKLMARSQGSHCPMKEMCMNLIKKDKKKKKNKLLKKLKNKEEEEGEEEEK